MKRCLDGRKSQSPPALPDLLAGTLGGRNLTGHCVFRTKRDALTFNDTFFFLSYLYCLNRVVDKVEALAQATGSSLRKDAVADRLVGETKLDFKPPKRIEPNY